MSVMQAVLQHKYHFDVREADLNVKKTKGIVVKEGGIMAVRLSDDYELMLTFISNLTNRKYDILIEDERWSKGLNVDREQIMEKVVRVVSSTLQYESLQGELKHNETKPKTRKI